MKKPYDIRHHFANQFGGCVAGTMICCVCQKPVDNKTQDWQESKKDKDGDWQYRSKHRTCVQDQSGWVKLEEANAARKNAVSDILALLRVAEGFDQMAFNEAMYEMGWEKSK